MLLSVMALNPFAGCLAQRADWQQTMVVAGPRLLVAVMVSHSSSLSRPPPVPCSFPPSLSQPKPSFAPFPVPFGCFLAIVGNLDSKSLQGVTVHAVYMDRSFIAGV